MSRFVLLHENQYDRGDCIRSVDALLYEPENGIAYQYTIRDETRPRGEGTVWGVMFQEGPVAERGVNGITEECLLSIVMQRLEDFQARKELACPERQKALEHLRSAMKSLRDLMPDQRLREIEDQMCHPEGISQEIIEREREEAEKLKVLIREQAEGAAWSPREPEPRLTPEEMIEESNRLRQVQVEVREG